MVFYQVFQMAANDEKLCSASGKYTYFQSIFRTCNAIVKLNSTEIPMKYIP